MTKEKGNSTSVRDDNGAYNSKNANRATPMTNAEKIAARPEETTMPIV